MPEGRLTPHAHAAHPPGHDTGGKARVTAASSMPVLSPVSTLSAQSGVTFPRAEQRGRGKMLNANGPDVGRHPFDMRLQGTGQPVALDM